MEGFGGGARMGRDFEPWERLLKSMFPRFLWDDVLNDRGQLYFKNRRMAPAELQHILLERVSWRCTYDRKE